MPSPEERNYQAIERLEALLRELRANPSPAREDEAIREIGLEIAIAVREVGAMLINVGWEQTYPHPPVRASTAEAEGRPRTQARSPQELLASRAARASVGCGLGPKPERRAG